MFVLKKSNKKPVKFFVLKPESSTGSTSAITNSTIDSKDLNKGVNCQMKTIPQNPFRVHEIIRNNIINNRPQSELQKMNIPNGQTSFLESDTSQSTGNNGNMRINPVENHTANNFELNN